MLTIFEFDEFGMSREGGGHPWIQISYLKSISRYWMALVFYPFRRIHMFSSYNVEGDMIAIVQIEIENVLFNYKWGSR